MEIKEVFRSTALVFVFIFLIVLVKITSDEHYIEVERARPQRTLAENPGARHFLSYPQSQAYSIQVKGSAIFFEQPLWVSQNSGSLEERDMETTDLRDDGVQNMDDVPELSKDLSEF